MDIVTNKQKKPSPFFWYEKVVFEKYATFSGRASRREYWWFTLFDVIMFCITLFLDVNVISTPDNYEFYITSIYFLLIFTPMLALQIRRLHDIGCSGWFELIAFIPSVGGMILLVMHCLPSESGDNKYGPRPEF
ncbi:DUF805 domain-containing protein [Salmonella enterica subsp. enterica]|nr:DUF805 domain-containing protein [Salmonella enterica subsp. enterica serovar Lomalinda]ECK8875081.1 DUF805 domain-containing protein [Salmonella enterica subsp. enterica]EHW1157909.1 DUF805 domain-containing protein [Salmonella enterica subsp. enterica serovar Takoradi]EKR0896862.1 DUF805 domain-containing protein [Salmonella enterica]ECI5321627.1 DUF805 domain-containing protein [Salmonella enterica subsp. enterica serovar Lomalinda]